MVPPSPGAPWWRTAVVYQIYPRSFADADGDGIGDLDGVRQHLDHLAWLGVDAVWLSPFYPSPMADFGYDVADFCDVDPLFGDLATFDRLVADAHERGLRVIVDLVPNHSSDQHPWFVASRSSRDDPKRDWYVWRDGAGPEEPPNNWVGAFIEGGRAWTWDETTEQWYLHQFLPQQPDLNWANPEVRTAMEGVMRFWLDRGVAGFRIDVVHCIGRDQSFPDDEPPWVGIPHCAINEDPSTHEYIREMRSMVEGYDGDRVLIGETALPGTRWVAPYYGEDDELHLAFNFAATHAPWDAGQWRRRIERVQEELDPRGAWPTWVLSNHDVSRHRTRYGGSEARARAAAVALLGQRGTPFLYAGEELGLEDAVVPPERVVDPGGRDGCRAPVPWEPPAPHGWGPDPWLPFPPDADTRAAAVQRDDPASILNLYRRLLAARRGSPALQLGDLTLLDLSEGALGWRRQAGDDERVVVLNMSAAPLEIEVAGTVEVASDGRGQGAPFGGTLAPDTAVLLRP
ncbi:MAG TPA: alpha-amylase family glycosyl hydrolase [Acidimicrobiales bacterium]|nr:alpha-amylase family glycosyl hydrolase [Acidimicrobiales bacterium]